ncbi:hypothetical protein OM416_27055 [Paenibacillus sp. LS1]|uniref:hypothetical protein n=1 Tax=Paenibacillus sp. LS1 TaxID=2992120 RepID=UPI0022328AAF|nr:hypothetical protein [Paenibacillus sp. LS1]MCW3795269.1 hypothetical protein [Paenibacillus sp. LS1]
MKKSRDEGLMLLTSALFAYLIEKHWKLNYDDVLKYGYNGMGCFWEVASGFEE